MRCDLHTITEIIPLHLFSVNTRTVFETRRAFDTNVSLHLCGGSCRGRQGTLEDFDSLQPGMHIQTQGEQRRGVRGKVSIPFKREGTFRHPVCTDCMYSDYDPGFDSLQAGKHIQTKPFATEGRRIIPVSIPFKRESTFRHDVTVSAKSGDLVSIPFKRESTDRRKDEQRYCQN